jgi:hypothetical protein
MRTNLDEMSGALSHTSSSWTAGHTAAADSGGDSGMGELASASDVTTPKVNLPSNSDDNSRDK